jgi:hypothetical protein
VGVSVDVENHRVFFSGFSVAANCFAPCRDQFSPPASPEREPKPVGLLRSSSFFFCSSVGVGTQQLEL